MTNDDAPSRSVPAAEGYGPLLQRDYWGVLAETEVGPRDVARALRERFWEFPPPELVRFGRADGEHHPLDVGDELTVHIRTAGDFGVRVVHADANSLTVATLAGHPEAGRITFGAYRNARGDVVLHIRSRARSSSGSRYAGFLFAGEPMQTNTWSDFINRLAAALGGRIRGHIRADTREVEADEHDDAEGLAAPTFLARGA